MIIEYHFHINGFTLNLALKQALGATWKLLICERSYSYLQTQAAKFDITRYKVLMMRHGFKSSISQSPQSS